MTDLQALKMLHNDKQPRNRFIANDIIRTRGGLNRTNNSIIIFNNIKYSIRENDNEYSPNQWIIKKIT